MPARKQTWLLLAATAVVLGLAALAVSQWTRARNPTAGARMVVQVGIKGTTNAVARGYYEGGRKFLDARSSTDSSLIHAIRSFEAAIAIDSAYAAAYAGLADARRIAAIFGVLPREETLRLANQAAVRAIHIDAGMADGYRALGAVRFQAGAAASEAEAAYREAVALAPDSAAYRSAYASYLVYLGRLADARREADAAFAIDPSSFLTVATRAWVYYASRDYRSVVRDTDRLLRRDSTHTYLSAIQALALSRMGRHAEAIRAAQRWAQSEQDPLNPGTPHGISESLAVLVQVHAAAGDFARARETLQTMRSVSGGTTSPVDYAAALGTVGEQDSALAVLERSEFWTGTQKSRFLRDPRLDPIRADARYVALATRLGVANLLPPRAKP